MDITIKKSVLASFKPIIITAELEFKTQEACEKYIKSVANIEEKYEHQVIPFNTKKVLDLLDNIAEQLIDEIGYP